MAKQPVEKEMAKALKETLQRCWKVYDNEGEGLSIEGEKGFNSF
jgi:hypothetical protein